MRTTVIIALVVIAVISALGGVAHENPQRGRNASIVSIFAITALAVITSIGG